MAGRIDVRTLKGLHEHAVEQTRSMYRANPKMELPKFILFVVKSGVIDVLPLPQELPPSIVIPPVAELFQDIGVTHYVMISEAWMSSASASRLKDVAQTDEPARLRLEEMPSQQPDRKEIVCIAGKSVTGERLGSAHEMIRGESGGVLRLEEIRDGGEPGRLVGPWMTLV